MSETPYLVRNPPARSQFRSPRRAKLTGCIVVHTAESTPDTAGPDTGAENVANFIRTRSTPGSYHKLSDSDSRIQLVRFDDEAYGDGTGSNPWAIHISAATQAAQWLKLPQAWRDACVANMAKDAADAARHIKAKEGITVPARRISKAQSDNGLPGFIPHGDRDPGRRTDPGFHFPWAQFLRLFDEEMNPEPEPQTRGKRIDRQIEDTRQDIRILKKAKANARSKGKKWKARKIRRAIMASRLKLAALRAIKPR